VCMPMQVCVYFHLQICVSAVPVHVCLCDRMCMPVRYMCACIGMYACVAVYVCVCEPYVHAYAGMRVIALAYVHAHDGMCVLAFACVHACASMCVFPCKITFVQTIKASQNAQVSHEVQ
jgi:succinate dehydrogenase hydrophobic anchor subunit